MRIRGPLAQRLHTLPPGAHLTLMPEQTPPTPSGDDTTAQYELRVFADYHCFLVQDDLARPTPTEAWTEALLRDQIATAPGALGVGTARAMTVPVTVEVRATPPVDENTAAWDHITQAGLHIDSGRILVSMFDNRPELPRIPIPPGTYTARVYTAGLNTLSPNGLDGEDRYRIVLWPGQVQQPEVLKRYPHPFPGG